MAMMKKFAGAVKGVKVYKQEDYPLEEQKRVNIIADNRKKCACHCEAPVEEVKEDK